MSRNKFTEQEKREARDGGVYFLHGWLDAAAALASDFSDGAWFQNMIDAVNDCNRVFGTRFDAHDEVIAWISKQEAVDGD